MTGKPGKKKTSGLKSAGRQCPICGKPELAQFRPFCSSRCADLDLGRWLSGDYRIAADEEVDFDEDALDDEG
ncbi:MAG: DNA gyrase inhibitor YacG [Rhodospirillales bacterium]|nr:DNA gyrase inhibitor YacG [Rhodospirillales bacterium]